MRLGVYAYPNLILSKFCFRMRSISCRPQLVKYRKNRIIHNILSNISNWLTLLLLYSYYNGGGMVKLYSGDWTKESYWNFFVLNIINSWILVRTDFESLYFSLRDSHGLKAAVVPVYSVIGEKDFYRKIRL